MCQPIVIFDSGLGGITVLKEAMANMPKEDFVFYGDNKNVPYGKKSPQEIQALMDVVLEKILPLNPKALVLGCNTATLSSASYLREKYPLPIVGIEPAIKPAIESLPQNSQKRVLLLATETTTQSEKLMRLAMDLDKENRLDILPLQALVDYAENLDFSGPEVEEDISSLLYSYDFSHYDSLVLGCTHFIWYRDFFRRLLPDHVNLVDGNQGTIRQLARIIEGKESKKRSQPIRIHFSNGISEKVKDFLRKELGQNTEYIDL